MSKKKGGIRDLIEKTASIVLAGGQGTRLYPLTQSRCKPAVSFGGRYRLIDIPLSNSLNAQIHDIFVISQYFASSLQQYLLETYTLDSFRQIKIYHLCPEETATRKSWFKGTADAIRQNLSHFQASKAEYFLILSGDQLYNMDFVEMLEFAKQKDADLTIAALPVEKREAKRMGLLKVCQDGHIGNFVEKPQEEAVLKEFALPPSFLNGHHVLHSDALHYLGSMGIYIFKREALFSLLEETGDDFGHHLIPIQIKKGKSAAYIYKDYWEDIGTIASYFESNLALIEQKHCLNIYNQHNPIFSHPDHLPSPIIKETLIRDSIISQGSIIEAQEITHSVLGLRVKVGKGSVIRDSVIAGNLFYETAESSELLSIGQNCHIERAIIDENCHIGNHVQLINKEKRETFDSDGIFIRDGIIVVTSGTRVPDHYVL